jgi:hypothetical protein
MNPTKQVVVLDFSIQADASVALLGGIAAPTTFTPGIGTRGAEVVASIPGSSTAVGFIRAVQAHVENANPPAPTSWWRGSAANAAKPAHPFDWRSCTVSVAEWCCHEPANLYLAAGGPGLHNLFPLADAGALAAAVRACIATVNDAIFIIDTDAELAERCTSLLGIAAADKLIVITSASWQDTQRLIADPVNSLFAKLTDIQSQNPLFVGKISTVCFNAVAKASKDPMPPLPFSPPAGTVNMVKEICAYIGALDACKPFFQPHAVFYDELVTAVSTIPDGAKMKTLETGIPIVVFAKTEAEVTAANNIQCLASRVC